MSVGIEKQNERRWQALMFLARLRGATDRDDFVIWAVSRGYLIEAEDGEGRTGYALSDAGREYADELIDRHPDLFG